MRFATKRAWAVGAVAMGLTLLTAAALQEGTPQDAGFDGMQEMMRLGSPGTMHESLEPLVGTWHLAVKNRMGPDAPWTESEATAERQWVLGGRFVQESVKADWMNMPFEGVGYVGYDNLREQFLSYWIDNMSTGMMMAAGTGKGEIMHFEGTVSSPMTGEKEAWFSQHWHVKSADEHVVTLHNKAPDGSKYESMVITYTRQ